MKEKRNSIRSPISITLSISGLFNHNHSAIRDLQTPIKLINISVNGIGFITDCILPLEHFFIARFTLSSLPEIEALVKIIRVHVVDADTYLYGCEFVNLEDKNYQIIETFVNEKK